MKCKQCGEENGDAKRTCSRCGAFLEGYTLNNVTGEYGYRGADGYFYKSEEEYRSQSSAAVQSAIYHANEKPSAAERMVENMKQLGKAISQMGAKASDLDGYKVQTPPKPIGYLEHEESKTRIPVFKRIGWFHRRMLRWCFGVKYIKED